MKAITHGPCGRQGKNTPPTTNAIEVRSEANESEARTTLDALWLEGARQMLSRSPERDMRLIRGSRDYFDRYLHREQITDCYPTRCLEHHRKANLP